MAAGNVPKGFGEGWDEEFFGFGEEVVFDSCDVTPLSVESLGDLKILLRQQPESQEIHLRALDKLREAPAALEIFSSLCSDHKWVSVGGLDPVSNAAEIDQELAAIEAVTLPRLRMDIQAEEAAANDERKVSIEQRKLMKPLVLSTNVIKQAASKLGISLLVDPLVKFIDEVFENLPIADKDDIQKKIASHIEGVRNSPVRLDVIQESTVLSAIELINTDIKSAGSDFVHLITDDNAKPLDIDMARIRLQIRAIHNGVVRLYERTREPGLLEAMETSQDITESRLDDMMEEEAVVDDLMQEGEVDELSEEEEQEAEVKIADRLEAMRTSANRMSTWLEYEEEEEELEEDGVLNSPGVGATTITDTSVVYDLRDISVHLQAILKSSFCLDERVCGVKAGDKKKE